MLAPTPCGVATTACLYFHYILYPPERRPQQALRIVTVAGAITAVMIAYRQYPQPMQVSYGALVLALVYRSAAVHKQHRQLSVTGILFTSTMLMSIAFVLWVGKAVPRSSLVLLWIVDVNPHGLTLWAVAADQAACQHVKHLKLHAWYAIRPRNSASVATQIT